MGNRSVELRWSARVPPYLIRRLYEGDARGMLDGELLDEVGRRLFVRCQDMLDISEAQRGRVKCPGCGHVIQRKRGRRVALPTGGSALRGGEAERLRCGACGWQVTWGDYLRSVRGRRLDELGVEGPLRAFVREWPAARTAGARLLCVDRLIHEFHVTLDGPGCPLAVNVLEGRYEQVLGLLQTLAYGEASTPGLPQAMQAWRANAKHLRYSRVELDTMARELGVRGAGRMRKGELVAAIERLAPGHLE